MRYYLEFPMQASGVPNAKLFGVPNAKTEGGVLDEPIRSTQRANTYSHEFPMQNRRYGGTEVHALAHAAQPTAALSSCQLEGC